MSTNKTENLNLHSWVETDPVLMSEFNDNFDIIDAESTKKVKIYCGSYVGDSTFQKVLYFPNAPKFVIVRDSVHNNNDYSLTMFSGATECGVSITSQGTYIMSVSWADNWVVWQNLQASEISNENYIRTLNFAGRTYQYIAFCI